MQGLTRGDGQRGDDITHNVRTLGGVPLSLSLESPPAVLEVRGEALIYNSEFAVLRDEQEQAGEQPFANPRNATAGSLKLRDPRECAKRKVRFLGHGLGYSEGVDVADYSEYLKLIREAGIPVTPGVRTAAGVKALQAALAEMVEEMPALGFEVDGIVIKVQSIRAATGTWSHQQVSSLGHRL